MKFLKILNYFVLSLGIFCLIMTWLTKDLVGLIPACLAIAFYFFGNTQIKQIVKFEEENKQLDKINVELENELIRLKEEK